MSRANTKLEAKQNKLLGYLCQPRRLDNYTSSLGNYHLHQRLWRRIDAFDTRTWLIRRRIFAWEEVQLCWRVKGKHVVVVGIRSTAADICREHVYCYTASVTRPQQSPSGMISCNDSMKVPEILSWAYPNQNLRLQGLEVLLDFHPNASTRVPGCAASCSFQIGINCKSYTDFLALSREELAIDDIKYNWCYFTA